MDISGHPRCSVKPALHHGLVALIGSLSSGRMAPTTIFQRCDCTQISRHPDSLQPSFPGFGMSVACTVTQDSAKQKPLSSSMSVFVKSFASSSPPLLTRMPQNSSSPVASFSFIFLDSCSRRSGVSRLTSICCTRSSTQTSSSSS